MGFVYKTPPSLYSPHSLNSDSDWIVGHNEVETEFGTRVFE
jgi:hypothetical protein